jgi:hypothetical protein
MMCSIHLDESAICVNRCTVITSYVYLLLKSWAICLIVWITDARCTVLKVTHLSWCVWTKSTPVTVATTLHGL